MSITAKLFSRVLTSVPKLQYIDNNVKHAKEDETSSSHDENE